MGEEIETNPGSVERNVAEHVRHERELRGWSTAELARRVTEAGCPLSQSAVWRIESGEPRRKISVDELMGFSRVLEKPVESLLRPPKVEFPEEPIKQYVERWLEREKRAWLADLDARVAFGDVVAMANAYPEVVRRLSDVLAEVSGEEGRVHLEPKARQRLADLPKELAAERRRKGPKHLSQTEPIIAYWRKIGMSVDEMISEAEKLGFEGTMNGSMKATIEAAAYRKLRNG